MSYMNKRNSLGMTGVGTAMVAAVIGVAWLAVAMTKGMVWAGAAARNRISNKKGR